MDNETKELICTSEITHSTVINEIAACYSGYDFLFGCREYAKIQAVVLAHLKDPQKSNRVIIKLKLTYMWADLFENFSYRIN